MKNIVWQSRKDGSGWVSSRTHGVIDFSYKVTNNGLKNCTLIIKAPRYAGAKRATTVVGQMVFESPDIAKAYVEHLVKVGEDAFTSKKEAERWFLQNILARSIDDSYSGVSIDYRWVKKPSVVVTAALLLWPLTEEAAERPAICDDSQALSVQRMLEATE